MRGGVGICALRVHPKLRANDEMGFDKSCLSGDCLEMMNSKGGKETNPQNQDGPKGLSKTLSRLITFSSIPVVD